MPATMRAAVLRAARDIAVETRPVPVPGPDQVVVKVEAVGVCGSDVHFYRQGRIGDYVVTEPLVLGHELSGVITATGADVPPDRIGQRVAVEPHWACGTCPECRTGRYNLCPSVLFYACPPTDGAFAEYAAIGASFAFPLPDGLSFEEGALLEPLSVAIAALRKSGLKPGDRLLVAGAGPIGIVIAQAARAFGAAWVGVSEPVAFRRDQARRFGADSVWDPADGEPDWAGAPPTVFIDASGDPEAVATGLRALAPSGVAVLVGMGHSSYPFPAEHIQFKELTVTAIFRYRNTWPLAIHLAAAGDVALADLVTARFNLNQTVAALEASTNPQSLKAIVYPGGIPTA
jgi:L-iditol 2-dehydrogenase